jgi:hypothetical protein
MTAVEFFRERPLVPHLLLYLVDVIEVVSECGMDVAESDGRNVRDNLVRSHTLVLMPHHDVEHPNAVTGDTNFATAYARRLG